VFYHQPLTRSCAFSFENGNAEVDSPPLADGCWAKYYGQIEFRILFVKNGLLRINDNSLFRVSTTPTPPHLSTTLSFAPVFNIGSSKSAKSSKNGSLILAGRYTNAYDLSFVKERIIRPVGNGASAFSRSILLIRRRRDPIRFRFRLPPGDGLGDKVEEGEGGCDSDEAEGELLGFEKVEDALEGKVEVYFCFLELDEEGVEEGVGREKEGGEGV